MDLRAIVSTGKALTLSLAAYLVSIFPEEDDFVTEGEFAMLQQGLTSFDTNTLPCVQGTSSRRDPRVDDDPIITADGTATKIFTDYDYAQQLIQQLSTSTCSKAKFECTEDQEKASFWLKTAHTKDFLSVPSHIRVSSFPYEGGFVRKDLLPLTIRRHCYHHQSSYLKMTDGTINILHSQAPSWWLPCFDLSTEFHLFRDAYERRKCQGEMNSWILKPSQGTRAQGHVIITPMMGLRDVAMFAPQLPLSLIRQMRAVCDERKLKDEGNEEEREAAAAVAAEKAAAAAAEDEGEGGVGNMDGEKVAQLFVTHPLLVHGRKFDIRVYVFVRSFEPFEAYMHTLHYARLANKPYHLTSPDTWIDPEVAITVSAYNPNPLVAAKQSRLTSAALGRQLELEHPGLRYDDMVNSMRDMLRQLFQGLSSSVGHWPRSSAYYALDVLFDNHANATADHNANASASATANNNASAGASASASASAHTNDNNNNDNDNDAQTNTANTNNTKTTSTSTSSNNNSSNNSSSSNSSSSSSSTSHIDLAPHHYQPPVPKLVEINYMGDWKALKKITVLENEERRARESTRTGASPDSNLNPKRDIGSNSVGSSNNDSDSNPDPTSTTNPDSQLKPYPDAKHKPNHNNNSPLDHVEEEEVDVAMLEWVEDLLTVLSTNNPPHPDRCLPLHDEP